MLSVELRQRFKRIEGVSPEPLRSELDSKSKHDTAKEDDDALKDSTEAEVTKNKGLPYVSLGTRIYVLLHFQPYRCLHLEL